MKKISFVLFVFVFLAGSAFLVFSGGTPDILVDSEWLQKNLGKTNVVVIDFGRTLEDYEAGHIPGAVHIDRKSVYDAVDGTQGMLPPPENAVPYFEAAGISNSKTVVIYDTIGGLWASRLFWGLEVYGHKKVKILDGGLPAWEKFGGILSTNANKPDPATFNIKYRPELVASTPYIFENLENETVQVIDTRSPGEFDGSDLRAEYGGHIPGAVNVNWVNTLDEDREFLPLSELAEIYDMAGVTKDETLITHCQTGVRGAHTYFVLRYLGFKNVKLYDESWVVWGNDAELPIAQ